MTEDLPTWLGIAFCLSQSAMFSGLNLAVFSLGRLELEVEASGGSADAKRLLALRQDSNRFLCTILWGNVGINVLLTLLSDSVMAGGVAFLFSTVFITVLGEIVPQAYFSRHAMRMGAALSPVLRVYRLLLSPVVWPSAALLDRWLGGESIRYWREDELKEVLRRHMMEEGTEIDRAEALGAINFLALDDIPVRREGVPLHPESVIALPVEEGDPVFPDFEGVPEDGFLKQVERSGKAWVVVTDPEGEPRCMLDADGFLRHALLHRAPTDPLRFCHRPVIVRDPDLPLRAAIERLRSDPDRGGDHLLSRDAILVWSDPPRLITGADLLGRLLRGIVRSGETRGAA